MTKTGHTLYREALSLMEYHLHRCHTVIDLARRELANGNRSGFEEWMSVATAHSYQYADNQSYAVAMASK